MKKIIVREMFAILPSSCQQHECRESIKLFSFPNLPFFFSENGIFKSCTSLIFYTRDLFNIINISIIITIKNKKGSANSVTLKANSVTLKSQFGNILNPLRQFGNITHFFCHFPPKAFGYIFHCCYFCITILTVPFLVSINRD